MLILGGMRLGWFTPTEAAVVAVAYGLFVGMVVYRTIGWRDLWDILIDAAETSGVILIIIGLASIFAYAVSTLGIVDPLATAVSDSGIGSLGALTIVMIVLLFVGMVLDGVIDLPDLRAAARAADARPSPGIPCGSACS